MPTTELTGILEDFPLDILGQYERINRIYTQIALCFPLPDDTETTRSGIIEALARGLSSLGTAFPWTAGQVVRGEDGVFRIKPFPDRPGGSHPRLEVKDLRDDPSGPKWDELLKREFPFSMLDEDVIAPCKTMVGPSAELPVLLAQANFIEGGLLLTVNAQHGSMDMGGQGRVIALLAKAMRGEVFSKDEVEGCNVRRTGWIPLLGDEQRSLSGAREDEDAPECGDSHQREIPTRVESPPLWAYLAFPGESLTQIKALAMGDTPRGQWVSRDDALTALIWQAISLARSPGPRDPGARNTTLTRNVDARGYLGLPPTYPGLVTTATSHASPVGLLLARRRPLGSVAAELRAALRDAGSLVRGLRSRATAIARGGGGGGGGRTGSPALEVRVSSWAREEIYDLDFGPLLGRPEAVRRPRFREGAREGLVYFLPRARDREVVVGVCLMEEDMQRLKASPEVARWARWIG